MIRPTQGWLLRPTSLNGWPRIAFLIPLGRRVGDRRLVIGAGWPIHRGAEVQEVVAAAGGKVQLGPLPASAPDRNPGEWLWRPLKEAERRNLTCLDRDQLPRELHRASGRVRQRPTLVESFFEGAELELGNFTSQCNTQ